jgi:hypothetical protein
MSEMQIHNIIGIGTDCIGSCKANYDTIKITTAPTKQAHNRSKIQKFKKMLVSNLNLLSSEVIMLTESKIQKLW